MRVKKENPHQIKIESVGAEHPQLVLLDIIAGISWTAYLIKPITKRYRPCNTTQHNL